MNFSIFGRLLAATGVVAAFSLAPLSASAYSSVVIFGDSLSDSGNNANLFGTDPNQVITGNDYVPSLPYASGTYSNGNVWATSFAAGLGLSALPSLAGGTNYAYGGAQTHGIGATPNLQQQVGFYLGSAPTDAADALFVIAGGGNNARAALEAIGGGAPIVQTTLVAAIRYAHDVGVMVDSLQAAGAQHIVVWNTPDLGLAPAVLAQGSAAASLGTVVASVMNKALANRLAGEAGVIDFDLFGLVGNIVANPGSYDLSNVTDACGAILGCDPSTYLYWDGIHPTSAGHQILANAMLAAVVPEPGAAWLFLAGIAVFAVRRRFS